MKLYYYCMRSEYEDAHVVGVVKASSKKEAIEIIQSCYEYKYSSLRVGKVKLGKEHRNECLEIFYG